MPKLMTVASPLALTAAGVVALAGCSSSSSGTTSGSTSAGTPASSSPTTSAAPSSSAAPASSSTAATSAPGSPAAGSSGKLGSVIVPLATKLGCPSPVARQPQAAAGAALGASAGISCVAGTTQYVLLQLKPGGSPTNAAKGLLAASGTKSATVYFVSGPQWIALGGPQSTNTPPTKRDAEAVRAKIGGTVGSASD